MSFIPIISGDYQYHYNFSDIFGNTINFLIVFAN